jgi:hypothetical protein
MPKEKSTPENGPRIDTEYEKVTLTEILVERAPGHPRGPGVSVISTYTPKVQR